MATLLDELSQIISALEDGGIEYAVCGGLVKVKELAGRDKDLIDIRWLKHEEN